MTNWKDKKSVLAALQEDGFALKKVDKSLKKDKSIVLEAVMYSGGGAMEFADKSLLEDKKFVLEALKKSGNGYLLKYVGENFRKDKSTVLEVVKLVGIALKYVDESFRKDKSIVQNELQ